MAGRFSKCALVVGATGLVLAGAARSMAARKKASSDEAAIRALHARYLAAFNKKDLATIMSIYLPGSHLFVFDVTPPRQHVGWEDYKKDWESLFAAYPGPLHEEISDLSITTDGKLAFSHHIETGWFTRADGSKLNIAVRVIDAYRKIKGKWYIVEEHVSVPVDINTGKADLLSKP